MLQQQNRGAVSEMIMSETLSSHRLQNHAFDLGSNAELNQVRDAVAEALQFRRAFNPAQANDTRNLRGSLENFRKVLLHPLHLQLKQETSPEHKGYQILVKNIATAQQQLGGSRVKR
jgi:hypothetical protein